MQKPYSVLLHRLCQSDMQWDYRHSTAHQSHNRDRNDIQLSWAVTDVKQKKMFLHISMTYADFSKRIPRNTCMCKTGWILKANVSSIPHTSAEPEHLHPHKTLVDLCIFLGHSNRIQFSDMLTKDPEVCHLQGQNRKERRHCLCFHRTHGSKTSNCYSRQSL